MSTVAVSYGISVLNLINITVIKCVMGILTVNGIKIKLALLLCLGIGYCLLIVLKRLIVL